MDELYRRWYLRRDVQQQFERFIPSLKRDGLVRELAIAFPASCPTCRKILIKSNGGYACPDAHPEGNKNSARSGFIRSGVWYAMKNFWNLIEGAKLEKCSILTSLESWYYRDDSMNTLQFSQFGQLTSDTAWYNSHIRAFDLFIDIDNVDFENSDETNDIATLDEGLERVFGQSFMKFSGNKGVQLFVPWPLLRNGLKSCDVLKYPNNVREFVEKLAKKNKVIKPARSLMSVYLDEASYEMKRLWRLPLCIHERSGLVSMPIKKKDLYGLKKSNYSVERMVHLEDLPSWSWGLNSWNHQL